jgi:DNA-directed RNA polymerase specialized sigma24 family protein
MAIGSAAAEAVLPATEVAERLRGLSSADLLRIKKVSHHLSFGGARPAAELRQEAIKRALAGTRRCPSHVSLVSFLCGTMRSIASADRRAHALELSVVPRDGVTTTLVWEGRDPRLSPEDQMLRDQEPIEIKKAILSLFNDDPAAQMLVEGMIEGMEGEELRELVDLSEKDFATKRRLVRRRIEKAYPKGWTR